MNKFSKFMLTAAILLFSVVARAADFTIVGFETSGEGIAATPVCNVRMSGEIVSGDAQKMEAALTDVSRRTWGGGGGWYGNLTLCLNSLGGAYDEGLSIAKFLLEQDVRTAIEPNAKCFSACAVIFMAGGFGFEGMHLPSRQLHVSGQLGFHAPYVKGLIERNYSSEEIESTYRQSVQAIRNLMSLSKYRRVPDNFMPKAIIAEMLNKGPNELFLVDTVYKAAKINVQLYGASAAPINIPGLCNACMNVHNNAGIDTSLEDAPQTCISDNQQISRRGNEIWFGGFGGEGTWYCVARVPGVYGAPFSVSGTLVSRKRPDEDAYFSPPQWYLYPGSTHIGNLR